MDKNVSAFDYKVTNLGLCHTLCCLLVWLVYDTILNGENQTASQDTGTNTNKKSSNQDDRSTKWWMDTAFLSTLLFAVHPVHVEAVSGIVGRADILAAITFFLAFLSYNKSLTSQRCSNVFLLLTVVLAGISMLCKENGVTVLVS